jgi:hypothetical protein
MVCISPSHPPSSSHFFPDALTPFDGRAVCNWDLGSLQHQIRTASLLHLGEIAASISGQIYDMGQMTIPFGRKPSSPNTHTSPPSHASQQIPTTPSPSCGGTPPCRLCSMPQLSSRGSRSTHSFSFQGLDDCRREVDTRVRAYVKAVEKPSDLVQNLLHIMRHSGVRMCSLQTTFLEMSFGVTEFQRYFLEVLGLIDFWRSMSRACRGVHLVPRLLLTALVLLPIALSLFNSCSMLVFQST